MIFAPSRSVQRLVRFPAKWPEEAAQERTDPARPSVLLATHVGREPDDVLVRATAMRDVLGCGLSIFRHVTGADDAVDVQETKRAHRVDDAKIASTTFRWCRAVLRADVPDAVLVSRGGNFACALARAAGVARASMIVVPHTKSGAFVRAIVQQLGIPVLIARRPRGKYRSVIAATDFTDHRFPVLREGLRIARGWVAPTVFVHNVVEESEGAGEEPRSRGADAPVEKRRGPDPLVDRLSRFELVERALRVRCPRVVLSRQNTVRAIFEITEREDADLIVVGTHLRARRKAVEDDASVAANVVARAARSVLVVPVADLGHDASGN